MKESFITNKTLACGTPSQAKESGSAKAPFIAPKLTFVKPELVRQGSLADVTAGFFGTFIP
jgi:hypothetical protein